MLFLFVSAISSQAQRPKVDGRKFLEEVPYEINKGRVIIPVTVEGKEYRFFLETGGSFVVSNRLRQAIQPKKVGVSRVIGVNEIPMDLEIVRVDAVNIGSVPFRNFRAIVIPNEYPMRCYDVDGIIGKEFLYTLSLHFNQEKETVSFTDDFKLLKGNIGKGQDLFFEHTTGLPYINIGVNSDLDEDVVFDTGADHLLSLKRETVQKLRDKKKLKEDNLYRIYGSVTTGLTGMLAPAANHYYMYVDTMHIAGSLLTDFVTDISKESQSRIGSGILKNGNVTVDYRAKRFYFSPNDQEYTKYAISIPRYGFVVRSKEDEFFVSATLAGSPAKKEGMRVDDKIISINGYDYTAFDTKDRCERYLNGYPWEDDKVLNIEVERGGRKMSFVVEVPVSN